MTHTIILSPGQSTLYAAGWWDARRIEDDCIELADRHDMDGPVVIVDTDQRVLFALTPRREQR